LKEKHPVGGGMVKRWGGRGARQGFLMMFPKSGKIGGKSGKALGVGQRRAQPQVRSGGGGKGTTGIQNVQKKGGWGENKGKSGWVERKCPESNAMLT